MTVMDFGNDSATACAAPWQELPELVKEHVASFLDQHGSQALLSVCKGWRSPCRPIHGCSAILPHISFSRPASEPLCPFFNSAERASCVEGLNDFG